jgi:hypothetical protein
MTAFCTDEYLALEIKGEAGSLNKLEQQFTTTKVAARRGRRLDECAHVLSFRPTFFGATVNQSKRPLLKE